ncbi:MAG TPA: tetratricopeptide repeat protein [Elusimicrobiota bacterium]|nr:tetratricopeptide repeat protein [Elusimicrobiota bacterium]
MRKSLLSAALLALAAAPLPVFGAGDGAPKTGGGVAARLMAAQRYSEAIPVLEREAQANPGSSDVLLNLGWAYWHAKRLDRALQVGNTLLQLDPGNPRFIVFLANTNVESGRYAQGLALAQRALRLAPEDRDAAMVRVRALFRLKRVPEAMSAIDAIIRRFPDYAEAAHRKAELLTELGRNREALATYEQLVRQEPNNPAYRRGRAKLLSLMGKPGEAETEWRKLSREEPDGESLLNLGWSYWADRDLDNAWRIGQVLLKLDGESPAFLRFVANLEVERMDYVEALALAQKAARLAPGDRDVGLTLSKALFRAQREKEAMAVLAELLGRLPDDFLVRSYWAEFLVRTGRPEEALPYLDRLIAEQPSRIPLRMNRARAFYDMGEFDKALAEWKALASGPKPEMGALRELRDDAYNRQGWNEAAAWQRAIIAADPSNARSWEVLARIHSLAGMNAASLAAAQKAIELDPEGINGRYFRAEALAALEDWRSAEQAYADILTHNPNSPRALDGLWRCLEGQRNFPGALEALHRLQKLMLPSVSGQLAVQEARLVAASGRPGRALELLHALTRQRQVMIPVLLYHGVARHDRADAVFRDNFRKQMAELRRRGYRTITVSELARHFQGSAAAPLPAKPLVLTFDDGRNDSFQNADPVLQDLGMRATMFVHLSKLRKTHFHASPAEIRSWEETGRWDLQSHGYQAHDPTPIDKDGRIGHFLANRMWLAREGRMETLAEFRARVEGDYKRARDGVQEIAPGVQVAAFAYPYGDYGQSDFTNTPESVEVNQGLVRKYFRLAFVQEQFGLNTLSSNPMDLKRFEVPKAMTPDRLAMQLEATDPWVQAKLLEAELWRQGNHLGRAHATLDELQRGGFDGPELLASRAVTYERAGDVYDAQPLYAQAEVLEARGGGAGSDLYRRLLEQSRRNAAPDATAEVQAFSDNFAENTKALLRFGVPVGPARLQAWGGTDHFADRAGAPLRGRPIAGREAGVQADWFARPALQLSGTYGRILFPGSALKAVDNYALGAGWQALPWLRLGARDGWTNVETPAAIRLNRRYHTDGVEASVDPALDWRATANFDYLRYNDGNREKDVRAQLLRRLFGAFSLGPTYLHVGSSLVDRPEYYTPGNLNQYGGLLSFDRAFGERSERTGYSPYEVLAAYEAGYGRQRGDSRFVQAARTTLSWRALDSLVLSLSGQYSVSPSYISRRADAQAKVIF